MVGSPPNNTAMAPLYGQATYGSGAVYQAAGAAVSHRKQKHMSNIKPSALIGFTTEVKAFLMKYKPTLVAKSYDPTADMTQLGDDCATFSTEDQNQESMKTALKNKTDEVQGLADDLYKLASSTLDAAISKLGKTTPEGKEGARIRSKLRGNGGSSPTPPPPTP